MKKIYEDPEFILTKICFERILEETDMSDSKVEGENQQIDF